MAKAQNSIRRIADLLWSHYGAQNWWPAATPFEVVLGAFLTQNTAWGNVEKAIANLRRAGLLSIRGIRKTPEDELALLIRPSGYFRQKARRIKLFVAHLDRNYGGSLHRMLRRPLEEVRQELLSLHGIGPETADSILLYAAGRPVFVVDAYTLRILRRHRLLRPGARYEEVRRLFESALADKGTGPLPLLQPRHPASGMSRTPMPPLARSYNELHAAIVRVGNSFCRSKPACQDCPLRPLLPAAGPRL